MMPLERAVSLLERVPYGALPMSPPTPGERILAWRSVYDRLSLEQRLGIPEGSTVRTPLYPFEPAQRVATQPDQLR